MKKIILLPLLILIIVQAHSQFGIKGGLNLADWHGDDVDDDGKQSLVGPYFGVFYNYRIATIFSIQPELVYSTQGVKYDFSGQEEKVATDYLNLTPLFRWNTSSGFYAGTGPVIGFLLSAEFQEEGQPDIDIKDDLKAVDFAWAFEAGYDLKSGLGFNVRYNLGLITIDDEPTDPADIKNSVLSFGLKYSFGRREL